MREVAISLSVIAACLAAGPSPVAAQQPPNIVFVILDDLSWAGTSVQMDPNLPDSKSDFHQTPVLEQLASEGMVFSRAYAAGPICSPTRASIMTGRSPAQLRTTDVRQAAFVVGDPRFWDFYSGYPLTAPQPRWVYPEQTTIMEAIKSANPNYRGGWYGKYDWGPGPGVERFDLYDDNSRLVASPQDPRGMVSNTDKSIAFMETQVAANKPFFMTVAHQSTKSDYFNPQNDSTPETYAYFQGLPPGEKHYDARYAAMHKDTDTQIGRLLDRIETLGIEDNTYVIFTSDHGAPWDLGNAEINAPLFGGKGSLWEGGIRVPLIVKGPGIAPGSHSSVPVISTDFFETFVDLAGGTSLPAGVEGTSLKPIFENGGELPEGQTSLERAFGPNGELFFHWPHYTGKWWPIAGGQFEFRPFVEGDISTPSSAIIDGDFKLLRHYGEQGAPNQQFLFNLANSVTESADFNSPLNLAAQFPEKVAELSAKLDNWLEGVDASIPYDVSDPVELVWDASARGNVANSWRSVTDVDFYDREVWYPHGAGGYSINGVAGATPTQIEAAPYQPGLPRNAFHFDGDDGFSRRFFHVSDEKIPALVDGDNSATFETWIRFNSLAANQLVFEGGKATQGLSLTLGDADGDLVADDLRFRVVGSAGNQLSVTAPINEFVDPTSDYVQLTAVVNDSTSNRYIEIYVNGALAGRANGAPGATALNWDSFFQASLGRVSTGDPFYVDTMGGESGAGALPFSGGNLQGDMAKFSLLTYALSADDVRQRYNSMLHAPNRGIKSTAGQAFVPTERPSNVSLGATESANLRIVQERNDTLDAPRSVDAIISGAVTFDSPMAGAPPQLAAGTAFTSYLLHYDPVGSNGGPLDAVSGSVSFSQDIIAILFDEELLASSDPALGSIGNYGLSIDRGLSWESGDFLEISADQRTLTFSLSTPADEMLQFRVLTTTAVSNSPGTGVPGDVDFELADWKLSFGHDAAGDADGDGDTDGADFLAWQRQVGVTAAGNYATARVPEPAGLAMMAVAVIVAVAGAQRSAFFTRRSHMR